MENCKFPRDVLIEILSRLPVKVLLRFKCVCKFFYTLIKRDHGFMHKHYEISRAKANDFAVLEFEPHCWPDINNLYSLIYKKSESDEIERIKLDIPKSNSRYVMCCHGMLCLILGKGDSITLYANETDLIFDVLIWKPFIREITTLPSLTVPFKPHDDCCIDEGFGFGLSNNGSWKIVTLWYFEDYINVQSNNNHEIVMVCHQIGDGSWSWRQISVAPHVMVSPHDHFYLNGRYYWRVSETEQLLWFDLGHEIFGIIELPSNCRVASVTPMNDNIALLSHPELNDGDLIEVWLLMNENDTNIYWHKHASICCARSIDCHKYWTVKGNWYETWTPIGIWTLDGRAHFIIFPSYEGYRSDDEDEGYVPYVISIDMITQEWKFVYMTQEGRTITILPNSTGFVQVYSETTRERNINEYGDIISEYVSPRATAYARVFNESLFLL